MIRLKYVDDPFDAKFLNSIVCFSDEHDFYDCVNRKFLPLAFAHLERTFHMYLLIGDSNEWIGYILLFNDDLVNGYRNFAFSNLLYLLGDIDNLTSNKEIIKKVSEIKKLLYQNKESPNFLSLLDTSLLSLKSINDSIQIDDIITEYYYQLDSYFRTVPKCLYLDVVIALPIGEEVINNASLLAENKYYGFIDETMTLIEKEINQRFFDVPVFLRSDDEKYLINDNNLSNKQKIKSYFN